MAMCTSLCELFEIEHPVLLAPMAGVSGGALAAAISNAGGLGLIGGGYGDADWLKREFDAAGDAAQAGKDKVEDFSDAINDNAGALKRKANFKRGNAAAAAKALTREAGKKAGRTVRDLRLRSGS